MKKIIIPVAAFMITATGAHAFSTDALQTLDIDLSDAQISAIEEVHELKQDGGTKEDAKEILEAADIDRELMRDIRSAMREHRQELREAVSATLEADDYDAFVALTEGTPIAERITSEDDFELLQNAQELRAEGDRDAARAIMEELGFEKPDHKHSKRHGDRDQRELTTQ